MKLQIAPMRAECAPASGSSRRSARCHASSIIAKRFGEAAHGVQRATMMRCGPAPLRARRDAMTRADASQYFAGAHGARREAVNSRSISAMEAVTNLSIGMESNATTCDVVAPFA